jgi:hypothetical protein
MLLAIAQIVAFLGHELGPKKPSGLASRIAIASEADNLWQRMD